METCKVCDAPATTVSFDGDVPDFYCDSCPGHRGSEGTFTLEEYLKGEKPFW